MALLTKSELKEIFSGLSSVFIKKNGFTDSEMQSGFTFDFDMPVTVDSFNFTQAEPTLNRTKVHGLQSDWCVTSTSGEVTVSMTVPSIDPDLVSWFLGAGTAVTGKTLNGGTATYSGTEYALNNTKLYMSVGLLSETGDKLCIIKKIAMYATPLFENASTTPFGFKLTGSIEATDSLAQKDIMFLTKSS